MKKNSNKDKSTSKNKEETLDQKTAKKKKLEEALRKNLMRRKAK